MKYIFFLGSHPSLSAAECFTVLQTQGYSPRIIKAHPKWLMMELNKALPNGFIDQLGGIDRIAELTATFKSLPSASDITESLRPLPPKFTIGISAINIKQINTHRLALDLKKSARSENIRIKFITPGKNSQQLNAAQILFNALHRQPNCELTLVKKNDKYCLAVTRQIQDIQSYELRDTARPARSGFVGMLPPKLAQIMLNITTQKKEAAVLDPFCGLGTLLQEGWLKGYRMTGTDSQPDMLKASRQNMEYIRQHWPNIENPLPELTHHDAGQPFPIKWHQRFDAIVTEPYLGPALSAPLPRRQLLKVTGELLDLYTITFKNFLPIINNNGIILFLLPAWRTKRHSQAPMQLFPDSLLDEIGAQGYSKKQLVPEELLSDYSTTDRGTLVYARPDALVGRELTLWQKS